MLLNAESSKEDDGCDNECGRSGSPKVLRLLSASAGGCCDKKSRSAKSSTMMQ